MITKEIKSYINGKTHYYIKAGARIHLSEFDEEGNETAVVVELKEDASFYLEHEKVEVEIIK